jgi:hypothetical protein
MGRKWWTLIAVSVATFMLLLDITVVNVALPSIREDLRLWGDPDRDGRVRSGREHAEGAATRPAACTPPGGRPYGSGRGFRWRWAWDEAVPGGA